ncbi:hypothetical protein TNCV_594301 [Trichonephila clavipes]|nr:hypothetical protein TNCV_594301 [Trichonephila clavipes]
MDIRGMGWTARSPDANRIEHVWDALGRAIAPRNSPSRTIQEMKTALLNEGKTLSLCICQEQNGGISGILR